MRVAGVQPRHPRAASAVHPAAADGGTPTRTGQRMVNNDTQSTSRRGAGQPEGGYPGGRCTASQNGRRSRCLRGVGAPGTAVGGWRTSPPAAPKQGYVRAIGRTGPLHAGRWGTAGIHPCQGTRVVAGSIWRISSPQRRDAPSRGIHGRCRMEKSLEVDNCAIS